jgi:hypothetical protein
MDISDGRRDGGKHGCPFKFEWKQFGNKIGENKESSVINQIQDEDDSLMISADYNVIQRVAFPYQILQLLSHQELISLCKKQNRYVDQLQNELDTIFEDESNLIRPRKS